MCTLGVDAEDLCSFCSNSTTRSPERPADLLSRESATQQACLLLPSRVFTLIYENVFVSLSVFMISWTWWNHQEMRVDSEAIIIHFHSHKHFPVFEDIANPLVLRYVLFFSLGIESKVVVTFLLRVEKWPTKVRPPASKFDTKRSRSRNCSNNIPLENTAGM